jgi:hypothetical protein
LALWVLLLCATPATAADPVPAKTSDACEHPCTHVTDCPKFTCECESAVASGVAACDVDKTHCCVSPAEACQRFCEVNHQTWTGRSTPEVSTPPPNAGAHAGDAKGTSAKNTTGKDTTAKEPSASSPSAACDQPCQKADDCRTMTCQCVHAMAEDVAACDATTHCCAGAKIVCDHFCDEKKDKWTGKVIESPPADVKSLLDEPADGIGGDDDEDDGGDDGGDDGL